jgi:diguanylate cyclase (GGDEF)-like protein
VLALAGHAVAVQSVSAQPGWQPWWAAAAMAAMGGAGLLGWRGVPAAATRLLVALTLAVALMASGVPGAGYYLLWPFVLVAVYPLVLPVAWSGWVALVVPAAYLVLVPLGRADGPLAIALLRAVCLAAIATIVHAAARAFRDAAAEGMRTLAILDTLSDGSPAGMAFWDRDLRVRRVNLVFARLCGYEPGAGEDLHGDVQTVLDPRVRAMLEPPPEVTLHLSRARDGDESGPFELKASGRWWNVQVYPVRGARGLLGLGAVATDVTEEREAARALAHSATHDPLTGLPNRALFRDRLEVAVARASRHDELVGVLFCDLDRFKDINDSLGPGTGDEILQVVAGRLAAAVRPGDTVARLGGDEFAVLCTSTPGERGVRQLAERVLEHVRRPVAVGGRDLTVTASVGLTAVVPSQGEADQLLADADVALYEAKDGGRDRYAVCDARLRAGTAERVEFRTAVRRAVHESEVRVAYQPILELASGRLLGFEALARWSRSGEPVSPARFIPAAEDLGLIGQLDAHVTREAAGQVRAWRAALPGLSVAVNVSPRELADADCAVRFARVLEELELAPDALHVEVTESAVMSDVGAAVARLEALRTLGVQICLDDFGTGYSSLAVLRDLPVDVLKIDGSFVARLPLDTDLVGFVVELARAIGATTVVEGVETPEQLALVRALGCDAAQGYLLGRPMPEEEAALLVARAAR